MSTLTEEQLRRIETNRQLALQRRAARQAERNAEMGKIEANRQLALQRRAMKQSEQNIIPKPIPTTAASVPSTSPNPLSNSSNLKRLNASEISNSEPSPKIMKQLNLFTSNAKNSFVNKATASLKGSCALISKQHFTVEIGFHQPLIEVFRTMPSRVYDSKNKRWNFSLDDHDKLMQAIAPMRPDVVVTPLPKFVVNMFQQPSQPEKEIDLSTLEPSLLNSLMEFQKEGVRFGIQRLGCVLIADDMGLGKTIQAIAIASYYRNEWPLLVVTPSSVRYAWLESFTKWLPSVKVYDIAVINSSKDPLSKAAVYIMSFDLVARRVNELKQKKFQVIIIDESHFLKNSKTARTVACGTLLKTARRRILLSGTPALSRPIELFPQLNIVNSYMFPSAHQFGIRYCDGKESQWGWDFSGASNMNELLIVLEAKIMIRRLKSEVIKQLPAKQREVVILDPSAVSTSAKMNSLASELSKSTVKGMEKRSTLMTYFAETGTAKLRAVCDYISELVEGDRKFLCFGHHQAMLDGICFMLEKKKCRYIRIDGGTGPELRKTYCDKFQYNDDVKVAVLSITATCTGITLTAAQLVVFAELFWNPGILTQAEDRVHRIGQEDSVLIKYLVAKGTADDHLWSLIKHKLEILNGIGLSKDNFSDADTEVSLNRQMTLDLFTTLEDDDLMKEITSS